MINWRIKAICCYVPGLDLNEGCQKPAVYQIQFGLYPWTDDFTETCANHLKEMLDDDTHFFGIRRIADAI